MLSKQAECDVFLSMLTGSAAVRSAPGGPRVAMPWRQTLARNMH
jgi:hypothetical protein